jgi:hypothetical protein
MRLAGRYKVQCKTGKRPSILFYEIGYRSREEFWEKDGYEVAKAWLSLLK